MRTVAAALITTDPELREAIREAGGVAITGEIAEPIPEITVEALQALEAAHPELVIVDLGEEPELGLRLAQYLVEEAASRPVLVAGPEPDARLLLEVMQAGVAEYLVKPLRADALRKALERVGRRHGVGPGPEPTSRARVYSVVGAKGGVGVTMVAASLAAELRRRTGERVLLVDLNFLLGDASLHLHLEPRYDVVDAVENLPRMDAELLSSLVEEHPTGLHFLASASEGERAEGVGADQILALLRFLRTQYAYLVVDTPTPFSPFAAPVFGEADEILLVTTPDVPALRNAQRTLVNIRRSADGAGDRVKLVVNRFDATRSVPEREIEGLIGVSVRGTVSNDYDTVVSSINQGRPVVLGDRATVVRDLRTLAGALAGPAPAEAKPGTEERRSPLAWLRRRAGGGRS